MKKKMPKLALAKETLRNLEAQKLKHLYVGIVPDTEVKEGCWPCGYTESCVETSAWQMC